MNKPTFIYIVNSKFTERDYRRFGCQTFIDEGFNVKILDVRPYLYSQETNKHQDNYQNENIEVHSIASLNSIKNVTEVSRCMNYVFVLFEVHHFRGKKIYELLTKQNNIKTIRLALGLVPEKTKIIISFPKRHILKFILKNINFKNIQLFLKKLGGYFFPSNKHIIFDYVVTANYDSWKKNIKNVKAKNIIEVHSLDYGKYMYLKNKKTTTKKHIVFIDQNLMFHEEHKRLNVDFSFDVQKYFENLNILFDILENQYKVKVIIAAHPSSDINKYLHYFESREIVYDNTAELIQSSLFVVTHHSTAISYAILFKKNILFVTTNDLNKTYLGRIIDEFASATGQILVNIDNLKSVQTISLNRINYFLYNNYQNNYIKKNGVKDISPWKIFIQEVLESNART